MIYIKIYIFINRKLYNNFILSILIKKWLDCDLKDDVG